MDAAPAGALGPPCPGSTERAPSYPRSRRGPRPSAPACPAVPSPRRRPGGPAGGAEGSGGWTGPGSDGQQDRRRWQADLAAGEPGAQRGSRYEETGSRMKERGRRRGAGREGQSQERGRARGPEKDGGGGAQPRPQRAAPPRPRPWAARLHKPRPGPPAPAPAQPGRAPHLTSPARSAPAAVAAQISLLGACALARSAAELSRDPAGPAGSCRAARRLVLGLRASSCSRSPRGRQGAPAPRKTGFGRAPPRTVLCGIARPAGPDLCALRCSDPGRPGTSLTTRDPPLPGARGEEGARPLHRPPGAVLQASANAPRDRNRVCRGAWFLPRRGCGLSALLPEGETRSPKMNGPDGERVMEAARGLPDLTCDASNGMRTGIPLQPAPGSWTQPRTREPWAPLITAAVSNCWGASTPPGSGFEETRNQF